MKKIVSIRHSATKHSKLSEFIRGNERLVKNKIISMINKEPIGNYEDGTPVYDFLVDENGRKSVKTSVDLSGETLNLDDKTLITFNKNDNDISIGITVNESLPQKHSVDQLKNLRKISKNTDIGDKVTLKGQSNNLFDRNPIDTGVESIQDYEDSNKKFEPNTNLKYMKQFKDFDTKKK